MGDQIHQLTAPTRKLKEPLVSLLPVIVLSCREVKRQCHLKSQGAAELLTSRTAPWKLSKFRWRKDKVNTVSSRCDHLQRTQGKLYK